MGHNSRPAAVYKLGTVALPIVASGHKVVCFLTTVTSQVLPTRGLKLGEWSRRVEHVPRRIRQFAINSPDRGQPSKLSAVSDEAAWLADLIE